MKSLFVVAYSIFEEESLLKKILFVFCIKCELFIIGFTTFKNEKYRRLRTPYYALILQTLFKERVEFFMKYNTVQEKNTTYVFLLYERP